MISEAQGASASGSGKIYSCLGGGQAPEIEFSRKTPLEDSDIILVCSRWTVGR